MTTCGHLDQVREIVPSSLEGCSECLASGGRWVHLRVCLTCGQVGCCDSSPSRHASKHAAASGHPLIASFEPGEEWSWCFLDEATLVIDSAKDLHRLPYPNERDEPPAA